MIPVEIIQSTYNIIFELSLYLLYKLMLSKSPFESLVKPGWCANVRPPYFGWKTIQLAWWYPISLTLSLYDIFVSFPLSVGAGSGPTRFHLYLVCLMLNKVLCESWTHHFCIWSMLIIIVLWITLQKRDVEEGADILMVKPGMPYLDIVQQIKQQVRMYFQFNFELHSSRNGPLPVYIFIQLL